MSFRMTTVLAVVAAVLAAPSCRKDEAWPPEPAPIQFGEDACAACNMIISDPTYAAQIRRPRGKVQLFDDIGCMLSKVGAGTDPAGIFVRAADGSRWVGGDRAYVLKAGTIASPMGYGFVAFATREGADVAARAHHDSVVIELTSLLAGPPPAPHPAARHSELSVKGDVNQ